MRLIGPLHSTEENYESRVNSIYIVFNFKYLLEKILRWKLYPHVIAPLEGTAEKKRKAGRCWQKVNEIQKFTLFIRI